MIVLCLVTQGLAPMAVKAEEYPGKAEIEKILKRYEVMISDSHATDIDRYALYKDYIAVVEKYGHPITDEARAALERLRNRAAREALAGDIRGLVGDVGGKDASNNSQAQQIDKAMEDFNVIDKNPNTSAKERYVAYYHYVATLKKYGQPVANRELQLDIYREVAVKTGLESIQTFMDEFMSAGKDTKGPAVTDDDYVKTIARKQDELNKKIAERDAPTSGIDTATPPISLYDKCYRDIPLLTPEFMPTREEVCKKQAAIGACKLERCEGYRVKHDYVQNNTCVQKCSDDVEAGTYTSTSATASSSPVVTKDPKNIDRLNFEIRALQRDIAELKINRVLLFSPKPATIMTKTTRATLAACLANLEKLRVSGLKGMAAKRDAALTAAKILSTSRARLDAKKKAEAAYAAATKGAAKQLTTAKAACQKAPGR